LSHDGLKGWLTVFSNDHIAVRDGTRAGYQQRILQVLVYIQQHMDEPLTLEKLAEIACFSPYHFHRIFRGMVGETLAEHLRRLRLERAAGHLIRTGRPVTDLAFEAGYETVESFTRSFRSRFGTAPSRYRTEKKKRGGEQGGPELVSWIALREGGAIMMDVKILKKDSRKVAFVRHIGPYIQCGEAWEKLCRWAGPRGLLNRNTTFLGLSYDDPEVTPADKIRYDACITVGADVQPEGEIGVQEIPAGDFAVYLHKGPFEKLIDTYGALCGRWLPESGREIKDQSSVEIYLNDPNTTAPEDLLVEIQIPLESIQ